jgi:hypothetical protein
MSDAGAAAIPIPGGLGGLGGLLGRLSGARHNVTTGLVLSAIWMALSFVYGFASLYPALFIALVLFGINLIAPQLFMRLFSFLLLSLAIPGGVILLSARINLPIMLVFLIIFSYAIFLSFNPSTRFAGVSLLWLFVIYAVIVATVPAENLPLGGPMGEAMQLQKEAYNRFWTNVGVYITGTGKYFERQTAILSGDAYTSTVDEGAKKQLGVFLENFRQLDAILFQDEPIVLVAGLRAETIEKPLSITFTCKADKSIDGIVDPRVLDVERFEQTQVACDFPAGLKEGTHTVKLAADFDFQTLSYIPGYFMDRERIRSLNAKGEDELGKFLAGYGITSRTPQGKQTPGPVNLGFEWEPKGVELPFGLDGTADRTKVSLGFSIDSTWTGRVAELHQLELTIPAGFSLVKINAQVVNPSSCAEQPSGEKLCTFTPKVATIDERTSRLSFVAFMEVPKSQYAAVLSVRDQTGQPRAVPVGIRNFKVTARYRYSIDKDLGITVRKPREQAPGVELIT